MRLLDPRHLAEWSRTEGTETEVSDQVCVRCMALFAYVPEQDCLTCWFCGSLVYPEDAVE